jgi:uncharacterized membrane protein
VWSGFQAILWIVAIVVAFRLFGANRRLEEQLRTLRAELNARMDRVEQRHGRPADAALDLDEERSGDATAGSWTPPAAAVVPPIPVAVQPAPEIEPVEPTEPVVDKPVTPPGEPPAPPPPPNAEPEKRFEWERFVGLRLPVFLGAIALCIAGFFFVSYAIESGFFTPVMRVLSAAAAALAFLIGAEIVRRRMKTGNVAAIASALGAAAIATAYATAYLATKTYGLFPTGVGFVATIGVTLLAIAIALAYGQVVALVGIVGGYLAPVLYGGDAPSTPLLVTYLVALSAASFAVIRYKSWWRLTSVALIGPGLWILLWTLADDLLAEAYWSSAFLISLPLIVGIASLPGWREDGEIVGLSGLSGMKTPQRSALIAATIIAAIGFGLLLVAADFTIGFWQGFIVFALLAVAVGFFSPPHRALQSPVLIAAALMLFLWPASDTTSAYVVIGLFALVFGFGALDQFRRLREPQLWAPVLSFVVVYLFAIALFKVTSWELALEGKHYWATGALALAAAMVGLLRYYGPRITGELERSTVYAAWGGTVTTLVSLAAVLELDPLYFPAASAIAVLGLAAVHARVPVRGLRIVATVYAMIYIVLIVSPLALVGYLLSLYRYIFPPDFADHALVLLILPGLALLAAATLFYNAARAESRRLVALLDLVGIVALAYGIPQILLPKYDDLPWTETLIWAARLATPELLLAAIAVYLGRRFDRPMAYGAGLVLTGLVMLCTLGFLIVPLFSFWPSFVVPGTIIFNVAALAYGLPALLLFFIGWYVRQGTREQGAPIGVAISIFAVAMVYALLVVDIRQAYHLGDPTLAGDTSQSEYYAYSIGTLVLGLVLLVLGVAFRHRGARALSFIFVLAATIKVFLFDASELSGLWRVLSFLLMGLSFLGISWAYARFVFGIGVRKATPPPQAPAE